LLVTDDQENIKSFKTKELSAMKKTVTILILFICTVGAFSQVPEGWEGKVMTVRGLIPADEMGITLSHEHLLIVHKFNYLDLTNEADAITELGYYANAGGKTLAEASAIGIGRNPEGLKRISTATGVNVLMCAGYYKDLWINDSIKNKSVGQLTGTIINDIKNGIGGIHAGFIKVAVSKPITPFEENALRAAALAQKATGAAVEVHFDGDHATVDEKHHALDIFENEGVDLTRVILCHQVPYVELVDDFISLAQRGCYLSFDMLGLEVRVAFQGEQKLAETLIPLIDAGYLEKVLVSQDVAFTVCYVKNGGHGYAYILNNIVPQIKAKGITDEQIHTIMVENPKRVFPFKNYTNACKCVNETFTAMTGTITDNSDGANYNNNMSCQKLIQPSGAVNVTLTFNSFATESGYDFVKVYDGATTSAPLLGQFSGTSLPAPVSSTGGSMLIVFTTDYDVVAAGWSASYTGNNPALSVTPESRSVSSASGTTTFTVTSNIDWSLSESSGWLTATKTNATTLTVSYDENTIVDSRSAEITVSGAGVTSQNIIVNQSGASPALSVTPESRSVSSASGTTTFTVASNIDWSLSESSGWLTATKTDATTLTVSYDENTIVDSRSVEITVSGAGVTSQNIIVNQSGASPALSVTPESRPVSSAPGITTFTVTSNIDWSVSESSGWLTATKTDATTLTVSYDENTIVDSRSAEITVSGVGITSQNITVNQSGASPALSVAPESRPVSSASGTTTFTVTSNIDWSVSESSGWLTATKTNATTLTTSYDENTGVDSRSAEITVSGAGVNSQSVSIIQEGALPSAVKPISDNQQISVFPNPFSNKTWITYPKGTAVLIEIYEPSGRLIIRLQASDKSGETEIDFSGLNSGLYIYRLSDKEGNIYNGKILKE
jgi:phosphotriesterase-related protein